MAQHMLKVRTSITINWSGAKPLALPGGRILQPGDTTLPMEVWHSLGMDPALVDLIVSGALKPVHRTHEFQDGDAHCIGCSVTRAQAEVERRAQQPRKAVPSGVRAMGVVVSVPLPPTTDPTFPDPPPAVPPMPVVPSVPPARP